MQLDSTFKSYNYSFLFAFHFFLRMIIFALYLYIARLLEIVTKLFSGWSTAKLEWKRQHILLCVHFRFCTEWLFIFIIRFDLYLWWYSFFCSLSLSLPLLLYLATLAVSKFMKNGIKKRRHTRTSTGMVWVRACVWETAKRKRKTKLSHNQFKQNNAEHWREDSR